jgi:hypothetical protein
VEKLLEDALITLSVVVSDPFGVSGRPIMAALIAGPVRRPRPDYYASRTNPERKVRQHVRELQALGCTVTSTQQPDRLRPVTGTIIRHSRWAAAYRITCDFRICGPLRANLA